MTEPEPTLGSTMFRYTKVSGPCAPKEACDRIAKFLESLEMEYGVYITIVHAGNGKINVTLYRP